MTARPQDGALLPCPFCGLDVTDDEGCFPLNRERTKWEVRCGNPSCFAHDPCDESRHAAIARWNRRSDAALASAQAREGELRQKIDEAVVELLCRQARAERLEEALRWYASGRNYYSSPGDRNPVLKDCGARARAALSPTTAAQPSPPPGFSTKLDTNWTEAVPRYYPKKET